MTNYSSLLRRKLWNEGDRSPDLFPTIGPNNFEEEKNTTQIKEKIPLPFVPLATFACGKLSPYKKVKLYTCVLKEIVITDIMLYNTESSEEEVWLYYCCDQKEVPFITKFIGPKETWTHSFGNGFVMRDGAYITGETETSDMVSYQIMGYEI